MTNTEYAQMMYADGLWDGSHHVPMKYEDVPEYAIGYGVGETDGNG